MKETKLDYNTLTAAQKAKVEFIMLHIKNHPDAVDKEEMIIRVPKVVADLI